MLMFLTGCGQSTAEQDRQRTEEAGVPTEETVDEQQETEEAAEEWNEENPAVPSADGELEVHFIDVDQGDATLLMGPDFTVLFDTGRHDRNDVVPYLQNAGVTSIDLLVGSHPHADHIGQMDRVLESFPVKEVWMSGDEHTSRTFERVLDAILASDASYHEPRAGEVETIGSALVEVINPDRLTGDFHEGNIAVRIIYGEIAFLLTADAEEQTEKAMINRGHDLKAHIFQLGHHGSTTSNIQAFLNAVDPEITIYSAGAGNSYGHPHREVLARILDMNLPIYGTDIHGTIVVKTDGKSYAVYTEKEGTVSLDRSNPVREEDEAEKPSNNTGCIDINSASKQELMQITHIGEERAEQLIQLRPFSSIDQLTRINGIGDGRLRDIKEEGLACVN